MVMMTMLNEGDEVEEENRPQHCGHRLCEPAQSKDAWTSQKSHFVLRNLQEQCLAQEVSSTIAIGNSRETTRPRQRDRDVQG